MKQHFLLALLLLGAACSSNADEPQILKRNPDPYGYPRPAPAATHVPVSTSYFIQLGFQNKNSTDAVAADSVVVRLRSSDSDEVELLSQGSRFADGYTGSIAPSRDPPSAVAINIDGSRALRPATTYTVSVDARSQSGDVLTGDKGSWQFTTADDERLHELQFAIDLSDKLLQTELLHQRLESHSRLRIDAKHPPRLAASVEFAARLFSDQYRASTGVSQLVASQRCSRARDSPYCLHRAAGRGCFVACRGLLRSRAVRDSVGPEAD
ncbi:MAG: hypothetical protein HYV60_06085 [Planctomycetia bacterium]|nr:hypothetical protein [Planctomycetia bacterium]